MIGELVNRGAWVGASSGLVSYEGFIYQMKRAADDSNTRAIMLDLESPGGEAIGAFEAAAIVRQVAEKKPVIALVNGLAASAAYALASGASRILTLPTGLSGSIGVVLMHLDVSKWLETEGVKPTLIFAGDHKVDGNSFEPLPAAVRKDMQKQVASFYDQFVETVAAGRGMSPAAVIDTQARIFKGEDAVAAGLADAVVGDFETALNETSSVAIAGRSTTGAKMDMNKTSVANGGDSTAAAPDVNKIAADAAAAAQMRIGAILNDKTAQGRTALAHHFAFKTAMSAEDAIAALAVAPKEAAAAAAGARLDGKVPSPNVGSDGEAPAASDQVSIDARWDSIVAGLNKETARSAPVVRR
jgi:signal peptide peptidase SppA